MIDYDSMSREELIDELKEAQQEIGELRSQLREREEYNRKMKYRLANQDSTVPWEDI